jgi:hypothetical protein
MGLKDMEKDTRENLLKNMAKNIIRTSTKENARRTLDTCKHEKAKYPRNSRKAFPNLSLRYNDKNIIYLNFEIVACG